jgi:hypothetical protein
MDIIAWLSVRGAEFAVDLCVTDMPGALPVHRRLAPMLVRRRG